MRNPYTSEVTSYSDQKLVKVWARRSESQFPTQMMEAMVDELRRRQLFPEGVEPASTKSDSVYNKYIVEVAGYSDGKIRNTLAQSHHYPQDLVVAVVAEAKKRGLMGKEDLIQDLSHFVEFATRKLGQGVPIETVAVDLEKMGLPKEEVNQVLNTGAKMASFAKEEARNEEKSSGGIGVIGVIVIVLFVVKMLLRCSQM